ncbi:MAG: hypothetical protein IPJ09_09315 [Saprospiraceae bacterium]|nr:hypothetical protein [Saprospiraceae bacterium]
MKTTFIFLCIALIQGITYSQNYLFESGSSGFHIAGQIGTSKSSTILAISPGYTMNGKLTFGLTIGTENVTDFDLNSTSFRPYLDVMPLKQGDNGSPISLNLGVHYQYNTFPKLSDLFISTIGFSINGLHELGLNKYNKIVPSIGLSWDRSTINLLGIKASTNYLGINLSSAFRFNNLYIQPLLSISKGSTLLTLSFGVIFPN